MRTATTERPRRKARFNAAPKRPLGPDAIGALVDLDEDLAGDQDGVLPVTPRPDVNLALRNAAFAVDPDPESGVTWSLRASAERGFWPPLENDAGGEYSVSSFISRFGAAGAQLRVLAENPSDSGRWKHIKRSDLVSQVRARLRDPGMIDQRPTGLCGPVSIVVELARRLPAEYVRAITDLFQTGSWRTIGGTWIEVEDELLDEPGPLAEGPITAADWILAASMRDDANMHWDVDNDGFGAESLTMWGAMADWTHDVLGLRYHWETCFVSGELDAIRRAQAAVNAGGVAFLLIDSDLIQLEDGNVGEDEEDMWWRRIPHGGRGPKVEDIFPPADRRPMHCRDDDDTSPPDHWVVLLGNLDLKDDDGPISMTIWSWAQHYLLSGTADSFSEYLFAIVTGEP